MDQKKRIPLTITARGMRLKTRIEEPVWFHIGLVLDFGRGEP